MDPMYAGEDTNERRSRSSTDTTDADATRANTPTPIDHIHHVSHDVGEKIPAQAEKISMVS